MRPIQVPTSAPAMPSRIVTMQPPGSLPGISNLAMAPMTRPARMIQIIECAPKSIMRGYICLARRRQHLKGMAQRFFHVLSNPVRHFACAERLRSPIMREPGSSQVNDVRGVNVLAGANFVQQLLAGSGIEIEHR